MTVQYVDARDAIYRPFWAATSPNPILEGQNYYDPTKALKEQYKNHLTETKTKMVDYVLPPTMVSGGVSIPAPSLTQPQYYGAEDVAQPEMKPLTLWERIVAFISKIVNTIIAIVRGWITPRPKVMNLAVGPIPTHANVMGAGATQRYGAPAEFDSHTTIFSQQVIP